VEKHAREVVSHYGDGMYAWEIVNESHDWANEMQLTPDQITNVTKLACQVAKDTNPNVGRLINNCCPFAEYVQLKKWGELDAKYPQRTPHQFMQDLVDNDVEFTITGQQMYFPYRDLADTIILIERLEQFGRPVQLTEVGASSGPSKSSIENGSLEISNEPYIWHRNWDQDLQAEWLEGLYTMAYSKPWIEAVNWYDFVDPYSWIKNGGLIASPQGEKKAAYERLLKLKKEWKLI
jgi:endo-1,4-beta-xylanase